MAQQFSVKPNTALRSVVRSIAGAVALLLIVASTNAQSPGSRTIARNGWRFQSPNAQGIYRANGPQQRVVVPNFNYGTGYYGRYYGGLGAFYYGVGAPTYYGSYYPSNAEVIMARGIANRSNAQAAEIAERARRQAIENQVHLTELRSRQRAEREARAIEKQAAQAERRAINEVRMAKLPTDLYPRLHFEEIDPATGEIQWPLPLQLSEFSIHRSDIEDTLREIDALGATEERAAKLRTITEDMKKHTNRIIVDFGFDTYRETRKFLCSLSVEGYYAFEEALNAQ